MRSPRSSPDALTLSLLTVRPPLLAPLSPCPPPCLRLPMVQKELQKKIHRIDELQSERNQVQVSRGPP